MHRGSVFPSIQVQQMVGGSPTWWEGNNMRPPPPQTAPLLPSSSSIPSLFPQHPQPSSFLSMAPWHDTQDLPESWSQLLMGGLVDEENRCNLTPYQAKKLENWEELALYTAANTCTSDVKQETADSGYAYGHGTDQEILTANTPWSQILPASSPRSCVTTSFSSNMLDFSNSKADRKHRQPDHSSECNSMANGSPFKKSRVQSSAQSTFKVRKEKLGDRITALHQIVSPFGKTDTASVLLEAIGYIRFLQSQIEALSSPYLGRGSRNIIKPAQGERCCIFPEDPGQLLNDASCMKRKGLSDQGHEAENDEPKKDLRSRGLCLVPVSFTLHVGGENGADYWAPAFGGGFR